MRASTDAGQQGRGLFGPIIVEEAIKPDVDLDTAIVLFDWNVDANGEIKDDFADPAIARGSGRRGGLIFANGAAAPLKLSARPGARVRLRLGNAATARLATIAIEGAKTLIVAVDGQPGEPFEPLLNQFPMGPGARFELMFDLPREPSAGVRFVLRGEAGEADRPFVAIAAEGEPANPRSEPPRLAANPRLPAEIALEAARRCDFAITGGGSAPFAVNGATFVDWSAKPAYALTRGQPAVFALANKTAVVQALRLWGHVARLLHSMDDGWEPYWRDTILIQPGRSAHIAFDAQPVPGAVDHRGLHAQPALFGQLDRGQREAARVVHARRGRPLVQEGEQVHRAAAADRRRAHLGRPAGRADRPQRGMPPAARPAAAGQQLVAQQPLVVLLIQVIQANVGEPLEHRLVAAGHHITLRDHCSTQLNHLNKLVISRGFGLHCGENRTAW